MNDHHPSREECTQVLNLVYEFHDQELSEADADAIRAHLLACEPCLDRYEIEQAIRELIRRSCGAEQASESLRMRVRATISRATVVTEELQGPAGN